MGWRRIPDDESAGTSSSPGATEQREQKLPQQLQRQLKQHASDVSQASQTESARDAQAAASQVAATDAVDRFYSYIGDGVEAGSQTHDSIPPRDHCILVKAAELQEQARLEMEKVAADKAQLVTNQAALADAQSEFDAARNELTVGQHKLEDDLGKLHADRVELGVGRKELEKEQ